MKNKVNVQTELLREKCTGCSLCVNICPTNAIKMSLDLKFSPVCEVNNEKCIGCNKCINSCPQLTEVNFRKPYECYASYPTENNHNKAFSSGGAATLIAKKFIEIYDGVVCGCTWDRESNTAKHIFVDNVKDLKKLCGSKYVQSSIDHIYSEIKSYIKDKKYVLFIGVPCQVAAIIKFCDSEYLYTIDLICHGTPPEHYLSEYLKSLPNRESIKEIKFRGENDFWFTAESENGEIIYKDFKDNDPYFNAFLKGVIYRDNCYNCKYAQINRVSDLTVGDFWELDRENIFYDGNISLILSNTKRGFQLFENTSNEMIVKKRCIEEAIKGNKQLSAPMEKSELQQEFDDLLIKEKKFIRAFRKTKVYKEAIRNKKRIKKMRMKHKVKIFLQKFNIKGED